MQRDIVCSETAIRLMEERCISIGYIDDVTLSYCSPRVGETRDLTGIPCHHIIGKRADHPHPSRLVLIFEKTKIPQGRTKELSIKDDTILQAQSRDGI
jgi:hypothetical protein